MAKSPITWNREDRDLIVELRTNMQNVREEVAAARSEIKEINTGISSRLLRLESYAVSKIEVDQLEVDLKKYADDKAKVTIQGLQVKLYASIAGAALALICAIITAIRIHL